MTGTYRVKHVWDPTTGEFVPERPQRIRRAWAGVRAWPWIHKAAALAAILRVAQVWAAAFWYDEGVTVVLARLPWQQMISATAGDVHPPGYYLIIWLLARILPLNEFTARIPSIIFSVLAVYAAAALAKKLELNERGQWIVTAWVVISPLQLHYAQEARMYALLQLEVLAALLLLLDRRRAILSVVMAAILYTHNYGVFYLPALALAAVVRDYGPYLATFKPFWKFKGWPLKNVLKLFVKNWLIYFIIPVLAWIPWLAVMLQQMRTISGGYWIQPVTIPAVIFVFYQMLFAYSMPPVFQGIGVTLTCGLLIYTSWRIYQDRPKYWPLLAAVTLTPLLLAVIGSLVWRPLLLFRGLIGTAVPLSILIVKALEGIRLEYKKYYAYLLIGVTLAAGLVGHYLYNAVNKGETETWVHEIRDNFNNGDVIVSLNDNGIIAAMTYAPELPLYKLESCGTESLGSLSQATRAALQVQEADPDYLINQIRPYNPKVQYTRIWFISTIAPVSPPCEIEAAQDLINNTDQYRVKLIRTLADTEYAQAGIYLITSKEVY